MYISPKLHNYPSCPPFHSANVLKPHWPSKPDSLGTLPHSHPPGWKGRHGAQNLILWDKFHGIIVLRFVSCPPNWFVIWFYPSCASPTVPCGFFFIFGCRVSFWKVPEFVIFLSVVVQQLDVFLWRVNSYPTPPSWTNLQECSFLESILSHLWQCS